MLAFLCNYKFLRTYNRLKKVFNGGGIENQAEFQYFLSSDFLKL